MNLSEVIKTRRRTLGISQIDLSEMSGVALATIKDILGMEILFKVRQTV